MAVVFTDSFTVAVDIGIALYPTGSPDYAYNSGSLLNLTVNAANDRVQSPDVAATYKARIIDAAVPTGDQEITADCFSDTTFNSGGVAARMNSGGADTCYITYLEDDQANECRLIRVIAGVETTIDSVDAGFAGGSARSHRLRVTGAGATVTLVWQIGTMTERTFLDTSADRLTSGPPGICMFNSSGNTVWVDNVSVDDLIAADSLMPQYWD